MYRHTVQTLLHQRPIRLRVHRQLLQLVQRIEAVDDAREQRVLQVQVRLRRVRDEELAGIRVWAAVGHRHHAALVVPQVVLELVVELAIPDGRAALAGAGRVARLHDEALDVAMEQVAVVVVAGAQREEVLARLRAVLAEQLQLDVADIGVQGDGLVVARNGDWLGTRVAVWMECPRDIYTILTMDGAATRIVC